MTKLEQSARQLLDVAEDMAASIQGISEANDLLAQQTITTMREALAEQAEQEPVAWRVRGYNQFKTGNPAPWRYVDGADKPTVNKPDCCDFEPLYAAPVRTKDLTDEEIAQAVGSPLDEVYLEDFRAVIAAYKEKNK